eukprot:TRINITY_DN102620_c0_g1_i1.p1 TRINITY_DN102620_c0_g1~~TRINITY_DN102620_c0_g1_i1.p1  ORF type:complete len:357 (-),score=87.03 TRINITY_DN102620_c0_g1_i1:112-1182(-)
MLVLLVTCLLGVASALHSPTNRAENLTLDETDAALQAAFVELRGGETATPPVTQAIPSHPSAQATPSRLPAQATPSRLNKTTVQVMGAQAAFIHLKSQMSKVASEDASVQRTRAATNASVNATAHQAEEAVANLTLGRSNASAAVAAAAGPSNVSAVLVAAASNPPLGTALGNGGPGLHALDNAVNGRQAAAARKLLPTEEAAVAAGVDEVEPAASSGRSAVLANEVQSRTSKAQPGEAAATSALQEGQEIVTLPASRAMPLSAGSVRRQQSQAEEEEEDMRRQIDLQKALDRAIETRKSFTTMVRAWIIHLGVLLVGMGVVVLTVLANAEVIANSTPYRSRGRGPAPSEEAMPGR